MLIKLGLDDKPNLRKTFEGILYRMRTDCPQRDLHAAFSKIQVVYKCFNRWSKQGIFQKIFKRLSADADKEWLMMDDSYIRAHQHAAGAAACSGEDDHAIGIGRGGMTSKIHLMVDACGNLLEIIITTGKVNDVSVAPELIAAVDLGETEAVSADKGYDSDKLRAQIEEEGNKANIPYKRDREEKHKDMDWRLYKPGIWLRVHFPIEAAARHGYTQRQAQAQLSQYGSFGGVVVWLPL